MATGTFSLGKKAFDLISTYFGKSGVELPTGTALELAGGGALLRPAPLVVKNSDLSALNVTNIVYGLFPQMEV